jgi:glycosyltransferase 2 family protein
VTVADAKTFVESPAGDAATEPTEAPPAAPEGRHHREHDTASHEALAAVSDNLHALDEEEPVIEAVKKKPAWRGRVLTAIRIIAALAIVFYLVTSATRQWADVKQTFHSLSWGSLIMALVFALLGIGGNMMAWRAALTDLDHKVPVRTAAPIALVGQLGKYLPGSVWAYVVQMDLGRRAGVPRTKAFIASLVGTGLGVTVGLIFGTVGLPTAFEAARDDQHGSIGRVAFYVALVLLPVALVCAYPKVLTSLIQLLLRVLRRPPLDRSLSWRGVLGPMGWAAFAFTCFGTHLWFLAQANAAPGFSGWARSVGVIALAMSVSVFVVIAPSGIGVREFLVTVALGGGGIALGIALASRLIFTIADVLAAGVSAAVGAHRLKQRP